MTRFLMTNLLALYDIMPTWHAEAVYENGEKGTDEWVGVETCSRRTSLFHGITTWITAQELTVNKVFAISYKDHSTSKTAHKRKNLSQFKTKKVL